MRLDALVRKQHNVTWNQARRWIETGKIWLNGERVTDPATPTNETSVIELKVNAPKPVALGRARAGQTLAKSDVVFVDTHVIVVNKPAGLNSVPFEEGENALVQLVCKYLDQRVTVVHRLDRETSGLLVFARTQPAADSLAEQFRLHSVARRYVALVQGHIESQTIRSLLLDNRGDGLRGSRKAGSPVPKEMGKPAVTHVKALAHLEGMTLIECRLETGRTHQIRIHLSEAGHPLLGEKAYIRDYKGAKAEASRLMLHAAELGFKHPVRETPMKWTLLPPRDFLDLLPGFLTLQFTF